MDFPHAWEINFETKSIVSINRELSSTFARLGREVDIAKDELQEEIDRLKQEIGRLDEIANSAKTLKLVIPFHF